MNDVLQAKPNSGVVPFLFGGVVGAAIGLLLAPKAGIEIRRQLKDFAVEASDIVSSTITKSLDIYDDAKIAVTSAVEAGKQAYIQEREKFQTSH